MVGKNNSKVQEKEKILGNEHWRMWEEHHRIPYVSNE